MDAKYISLANIEAVISKLPRGKNYVVVYGKGNYGECHEIKWAGGWTPELMRAYDVYQARLAQLHVLQHYEGPSQCLMALSPVQSNDDLTVGALSIP